MNHMFKDKRSHMETSEISASSSSMMRSPRRGLDTPGTPNRRRTSSLPRDGAPTTRTVIVGVKAHEELRVDIFGHARRHLGDPTNCRMVVVDCISRLRDEFGLNRKADDQMFGGANERKLQAEFKKQNTDLNFILNSLRKNLEQNGCRFDILTKTGRGSTDILIEAAQALNPHVVVLELSFAKDRKKIQRALQCHVALMKKNSLETPEFFEFTPKKPGPIDRLHDQDSQEGPNTSSYSDEHDNAAERIVEPEPFDRIAPMTPSRLPFRKDAATSGSVVFAVRGFFVKKQKSQPK